MRSVSRTPVVAAVVAAVGLVAWIAMATAAPQAGFQGWWLAFLITGAAPFGACALLLIQRLTGGRWGEAFASELIPAARLAPLAAAFALPCLAALPLVFPWAAAQVAIEPSVQRHWLNPAGFLVRQAIVLTGWSLIGLRLDWIGADRLRSGLALAFHALAVSVCGVDWILSVQPLFTNSAQGMLLATAQIAAALGWAALQGAERPARNPAGDLGGLLFAALLGVAYLAFMSFLVGWSGDRPKTGLWWVPRSREWAPLAQGAFVIGLLAPAALLAAHKALGMRRELRWAGASALVGLILFNLWQTAPAFGPACLAPALAALVFQGGLFVAAALWLAREAPHLPAPAVA